MDMELLHRAAAACLIFTILETVSSQVYVCAPVTGEVLLPCVCSQLHRLPHRVSVFWRDKEERVLLGVDLSSRFQHHLFRGRAGSFPPAYREGSFSVLPSSLQMSHSSSYNCYIPQLAFKEMVSLSVSDDCVSEAQAPPGPSSGDTRLTPSCLHLITSLALFIFLQWSPS